MRRASLLGATVLVLAGCADGDAGTAPGARTAVPPVPGIEAESVLLRTDVAAGNRFQVRVTATGDEGFTVTSVALEVPGFVPVPQASVVAEFVPGRVIDLPVSYEAVDCAVRPAPAAARIAVVRPDGTSEELRVPLAGDVPARVHAEECAAQRLAGVVEVTLVDLEPRDGEVTGRLALRRVSGNESLTVHRLGRSVLLDVEADLPLVLDDAADAAVTFRPATCDPHVLSETKQPYVFPLEVTLGEDRVVVDLPVDDALRAALAELVQRVCASG